MSLERVGMEAWDPEVRGTSPNLLKQVLSGRRELKVPLMEAVATALHVDPNEFLEYRLARFRELTDERVVGLEQAWTNYRDFIAGLTLLASETATELEHTASSETTSEASAAEVRSLLEARKRQRG